MLARLALAIGLALLVAAPLTAGKYNPTRSIGDEAPAWKDLPGTDGKTHSLADLKDKDVVVVFFTCNSCDVATDYEERVIAFAKQYAGAESKLAVVAINVNTIEEDRLDKMKERAAAKKFPFVYLYDESQQIAKDYGATWTPEFFVLDKSRKIVYMGGFDDASTAANVKHQFLTPAIDAILAGKKPETAETPAIGCAIRYAKKRRVKE